jgi:hypothetical protein
MSVFFAYIDDAGTYKEQRDDTFVERHPYGVRGHSAEEWRRLSTFQTHLLSRFTGQSLHELKWNHIWKLRRRDIFCQQTSFHRTEEFLENVPFQNAETYAHEFLAALAKCNAKVICTITLMCVFRDGVAERQLEKMHLQD